MSGKNGFVLTIAFFLTILFLGLALRTNNILCFVAWDPVCGQDNKTYDNQCQLKAGNVQFAYGGACLGIAKEKVCQTDADCGCGFKKDANECFVGNIKYLNIDKNCSGFCFGINKQFKIRCLNNSCSQAKK